MKITLPIEMIAGDQSAPMDPLAGPAAAAGLAALLAGALERAGVPRETLDPAVLTGRVWISDRWLAEIAVAGHQRADEADFAQGHHLLYRLTEFAAAQLGAAALPEALTRSFDDLETPSPAAMLAYWAGLGAEGEARRRHWIRAFELSPTMVAPRLALARSVLESGGDARAAAGLLAGVTVHDPAAAAELGMALWAGLSGDAGPEEIAVELLQSAVKGDSQNALAAAALAALLARRGLTGAGLDEALLLATHATQLASDDFRCWAALADVHRAAGDFKQASFFYGFALRLQPDAPSVLKDAAACWLMARQPDHALPLIERSLAAAPDDADHFGNLAFARDLMGQPAAALEAARQAAALRPADPRLRVLLGDLANKAGHREEALDAWARAVEMQPGLLIHPDGGNILQEVESHEP